jgi:arabinose-5-phosphate isomerase
MADRLSRIVEPKPAGDGRAADFALRTIELEAAAVAALREAVGAAGPRAAFNATVDLILRRSGRVVVTGMGKSGLIGRKIAATLSSTGTPSFFIHPADAGHGDLGMIALEDVVLALSWSGETVELTDIVNYCRRFEVPLIAITSAAHSTLAQQSEQVLLLPEVEEACPHQLAPTSSTVIQLAMGDALAVALISMRGFSPQDFRVFHPRGQLAAQLVVLDDIMSKGDAIPRVAATATIVEAVVEMTQKRFGVTAVPADHDRLLGIFTDGDLRRSIRMSGPDETITDHFSDHPIDAPRQMLATEALAVMNRHNISQLLVTDGDKLVGIVHLHDLLRVGVI